MKSWILQLDELLRGERTKSDSLRESKLKISTFGVSILIGGLAMTYGLCMGSFSLVQAFEVGSNESLKKGALQTVASMSKMPLLYLTTLFITFPSLYVFSALVGSRLKVTEVLRLLVAGLAVNMAVLASLGPIVAFFSVSTPSYNFVLLLNVLCCGLAGILGLVFLLQTLHRMTDPELQNKPARPTGLYSIPEASRVGDSSIPAEPTGPLAKSADHILGHHVRKVFWIWIFVFGLVGAQMSWVLRPFIGSPGKDFSWLRPRESNVFQAVWSAFQGLF